MLIFPYAFVDTSQAWLEPRQRRIAASAAGPADLALGALFALGCLAAPAGPTAGRGDSRLLVRYSVLALAWSVVAAGFVVASESAREELAGEHAALRSMVTLVPPSVPPGEISLRLAVRPERLLDVDGARVVRCVGRGGRGSRR